MSETPVQARRYAVDLTINGQYDPDPSNIATWIEAAIGRAHVLVDATVYDEATAKALEGLPDLLKAAKGGLFALQSVIMLSTELNKAAKVELAKHVATLEIAIAHAEGTGCP